MDLTAELVWEFEYPPPALEYYGTPFYCPKYYGEVYMSEYTEEEHHIAKFYEENENIYIESDDYDDGYDPYRKGKRKEFKKYIRNFYEKGKYLPTKIRDFIEEGRRLYGDSFDEFMIKYTGRFSERYGELLYIEIIEVDTGNNRTICLGDLRTRGRAKIFTEGNNIIFNVEDFVVIVDLETSGSVKIPTEMELVGVSDKFVYVSQYHRATPHRRMQTLGEHMYYYDLLKISRETGEITSQTIIDTSVFHKILATHNGPLLYRLSHMTDNYQLISLATREILFELQRRTFSDPPIYLVTMNGYDILFFEYEQRRRIGYSVLGSPEIYNLECVDYDGEHMDPLLTEQYDFPTGDIENVFVNEDVIEMVIKLGRIFRIFRIGLPFSRVKRAINYNV